MSWAHRYIGARYVEDGSDGGFHCWSLVCRVLRDEAGIELPSYGETTAADLAAVAHSIHSDAAKDPWMPVAVADVLPLDVVVMTGRLRANGTTRRMPVHVGVMVDNVRMMHIEEGIDCVQVPLFHPSVKFRIQKVYRHKALAYVATDRPF